MDTPTMLLARLITGFKLDSPLIPTPHSIWRIRSSSSFHMSANNSITVMFGLRMSRIAYKPLVIYVYSATCESCARIPRALSFLHFAIRAARDIINAKINDGNASAIFIAGLMKPLCSTLQVYQKVYRQ